MTPLSTTYHSLLCFIALIFDGFASVRLAPNENDLQMALLRQQLRVLERKAKTKPRLSRPKELMLVALTTRLQVQTRYWQKRLQEAVLLIQPETVLNWHREFVRWKWMFQHPNRGGRPRLNPDIETLIIGVARENPRMGYGKIQGESLKLGFTVDPTTVKNVLRCHRLLPAPSAVRRRGARF